MSERSSLISQYIYNDEDYIKCKEALEHNLITFEEIKGVPIIACYVHVTCCQNIDWIEVEELLRGVITKKDVRFCLLMDGGTDMIIVKKANGEIEDYVLENGKE